MFDSACCFVSLSSAMLGSIMDSCSYISLRCLCGLFPTFHCFWQSLVRCCVLLRSTRNSGFSGRRRRTAGSTVDTCRRQTLEIFWTSFHAFLRESGLRILRLMSLSVASPEEYRKWIFWECTKGAYAWFNIGYKFLRQSTVTSGRNSHISYVKVTSDPEVDTLRCAMPGSTMVHVMLQFSVLLDVFHAFST